MTKSLNKSIYQDILYMWDRWNYFWWLFNSWEHLEQLQDLYDWAKRNRLGVQHYYKRQFKTELIILKNHADTYPETVQWSRRLYNFWQMIRIEPEYYPKDYVS